MSGRRRNDLRRGSLALKFGVGSIARGERGAKGTDGWRDGGLCKGCIVAVSSKKELQFDKEESCCYSHTISPSPRSHRLITPRDGESRESDSPQNVERFQFPKCTLDSDEIMPPKAKPAKRVKSDAERVSHPVVEAPLPGTKKPNFNSLSSLPTSSCARSTRHNDGRPHLAPAHDSGDREDGPVVRTAVFDARSAERRMGIPSSFCVRGLLHSHVRSSVDGLVWVGRAELTRDSRRVDDAGPGGTLAIIFCRIDDAPERPYLLHLSYTPSSTSSEPTRKKFYQEWFPNSIDLISPLPHYGVESWSVTFPGLGSFEYRIQDGAGAIGEVVYRVEDLDLGVKFEGRIIGRTAWDERDGRLGPEGNLAHLDHLLGQHWVRSLFFLSMRTHELATVCLLYWLASYVRIDDEAVDDEDCWTSTSREELRSVVSWQLDLDSGIHFPSLLLVLILLHYIFLLVYVDDPPPFKIRFDIFAHPSRRLNPPLHPRRLPDRLPLPNRSLVQLQTTDDNPPRPFHSSRNDLHHLFPRRNRPTHRLGPPDEVGDQCECSDRTLMISPFVRCGD